MIVPKPDLWTELIGSPGLDGMRGDDPQHHGDGAPRGDAGDGTKTG